jgi:hypothetical protein
MLILQIALGIVLGALILRYLPQILKGGLVFGLVLAVTAVAILAVIYAKAHWDTVGFALGMVAFVVLLGLIIQFSARGLGVLFVPHIAAFRNSPRLQRCIRLVGIKKDLLFSNASRADLVSATGDKLFLGLFRFACFYLLAVIGLWAPLILILDALETDKHYVIARGMLLFAAIIPAICLALWVRRAPRSDIRSQETIMPTQRQ